ncbi:MAG: type IV secretory system conjugative DNA transfer family protein, partial [Waddliaceae bacterium]
MEDASQNILVLGGIGSGKTTRVMHSLLFQLLEKGCGGLIFDIKGDFFKATVKLTNDAKRDDVIVFGPGHEKMNLLSGLRPEMAASFLKSAFLLGSGSRPDSFWIDTATELCRNALGVLSFVPHHFSLDGLYTYLFDENQRDEIDARVREKLPGLDERQTRLLRAYLNYHESVFSHFDEKVISGVNATVSLVLSPFNHPDLIDAFCTEPPPKDGYDPFQLEDILMPFVIFVDLPLAVWGLGAKVVYTFIKLRFFNIMQRRHSQTEYDYEDPIFFMCDEYQEIISANKDGLSDLNFWDKSRSSKTIGIISTQSVSSIYASINNRDLSNAILQNFRQKICFRTEDQATIEMFHRLLGRVEVERIGFSHGQSTPKSLFSSSSPSENRSENKIIVEKAVLDPQLIRNLHQGQALALLSINGKSHDDIINTTPIYI